MKPRRKQRGPDWRRGPMVSTPTNWRRMQDWGRVGPKQPKGGTDERKPEQSTGRQ